MKKVFLIIPVLIIIAAVGYIFLRPQKKEVVTPVTENSSQQEKQVIKPSTNIKTYSDPSGFKFDYPEDLVLDEKKDLDNKTYADLNFTSPTATGSLHLVITDTLDKDVNTYLKKNPESSAEGELKDEKLAEMKASEISSSKKLSLLAIDQNIFYKMNIDFADQQAYWQEAYNKIKSTFTFYTPESSSASTSSDDTSSGDVLEEE